jgi:hypothetical protein
MLLEDSYVHTGLPILPEISQLISHYVVLLSNN